MSEHGELPVVFLNRATILDAFDTEYRDVFVPEWNGSVRVRSISATERERLMRTSLVLQGKGKDAVQKVDMPTFRVKLVALAVVDPEGRRVFDDGDVAALGRKSARAVDRIYDVAAELGAIEDDAKDDGDDPGKDFATTPDTGSDSSSPSPSG